MADNFTLPLDLPAAAGVALAAAQLFANWGFADGELLEDHPAYLQAVASTGVDADARGVLADLIEQHLLPALPAPLRTYRLASTTHNPVRAEDNELHRQVEFKDFEVQVTAAQIAELLLRTGPAKRRAPGRRHARPAERTATAPTLPLDLGHELIIDNFAGGGGTSTGLEAAFGRPVDIAINHDPEALAMHAINHPHTRHLCESVWEVDPIAVTNNQPVALVWLSPDCKHFSKAKGGTPVAKHIRGLAWVGMRWAALCKPRVLMLENVEEFKDWGPLIVGTDGLPRPDPAKKGKTFESFKRQLRAHGYTVDHRELRACDYGAPTIRKRLFLIARRDGLPIVWPDATHAEPTARDVLAGNMQAYRTAAECIDWDIAGRSLWDRPKPLAVNTQRRVAKGLWRHVLTSASPFIVGVGGRMGQSPERSVHKPAQTITSKADSCIAQPVLAPFLTEHANASNQRTMAANEPVRTICAQVKGGHFSVVAPALAPLRGTSEAHLGGHDVQDPLSTISAGGQHHALMAAHITKFRTGSVGSDIAEPLPTITAGGTPKRPSTGNSMGMVGANLITIGYGERPGQDARAQSLEQPIGTVVTANKHAVVSASLIDMGHGEGKTPGRRFSHGVRSLGIPLGTVTASGATAGLVGACLEQAYGGFYNGDGRAANDPMSTITASGSQQRLVTAYCVKYYSSGGQDQHVGGPMHTLPTKGRMGLVQSTQVPAGCLTDEQRTRAKQCADLLREHLPEHFPEPADLVLMFHDGQWWALVDITLRMLKPKELFAAQGFPATYIFNEVPDPALLFAGGEQASDPLGLPRITLTNEAQVRMVGNSVSPPMSEALVRANFSHEDLIYRKAA
jgi:DNA (cytosine-5)-methyltransferase 1